MKMKTTKEDVNVTSQMAGVDKPLKKKPQKRLDEDGYLNYLEHYFTYQDNNPEEVEVIYDPENGAVALITANKSIRNMILNDAGENPDIQTVEEDFLVDGDLPNIAQDEEDYDDEDPETPAYDEDELDGIVGAYAIYLYPKPDEAILGATIMKSHDESMAYDTSLLTDDKELVEVIRKIRINSKGKRIIKYKCQKGYKWNGKSCQPIGGTERNRRRMAIKKAVRTKKAKGGSYYKRIARKRNKARRFRKAQGLR